MCEGQSRGCRTKTLRDGGDWHHGQHTLCHCKAAKCCTRRRSPTSLPQNPITWAHCPQQEREAASKRMASQLPPLAGIVTRPALVSSPPGPWSSGLPAAGAAAAPAPAGFAGHAPSGARPPAPEVRPSGHSPCCLVRTCAEREAVMPHVVQRSEGTQTGPQGPGAPRMRTVGPAASLLSAHMLSPAFRSKHTGSGHLCPIPTEHAAPTSHGTTGSVTSLPRKMY